MSTTPSRRSWFRLKVGASLAATVALLAGCAAPAASPSAGGQPDVTLQVWSVIDPASTTDPRGTALKEQLAAFKKSNPHIHVNVTLYPFANIAQELIRATATGGGPDVVDVYDPTVPQMVEAGALMPMDKYVKPYLSQQGKNYIYPTSSLKGGTANFYTIAYEMRAQVLWYRQDMLQQAGVTLPKSLADLATDSGKLSSLPGSPTGFGFGLSTELAGSDLIEKFLPILWGFGGDYLDKNGKATFNNADGVKAVQYLMSIRDAGGYTDGALRTDSDDVLAAVRAGSVATTIGGTQRVATARTGAGIGDKLVTAPIPGVKSGTDLPTLVEGWTYGIGANSKHPDEAWNFIKAKLSPQYQALSAKAGVLPILASSYADASPELKTWQAYIAKDGRSPHYPDDWSELNTDFTTAIQQIIFQNAPVKATLDKLAQEYDAKH